MWTRSRVGTQDDIDDPYSVRQFRETDNDESTTCSQEVRVDPDIDAGAPLRSVGVRLYTARRSPNRAVRTAITGFIGPFLLSYLGPIFLGKMHPTHGGICLRSAFVWGNGHPCVGIDCTVHTGRHSDVGVRADRTHRSNRSNVLSWSSFVQRKS